MQKEGRCPEGLEGRLGGGEGMDSESRVVIEVIDDLLPVAGRDWVNDL